MKKIERPKRTVLLDEIGNAWDVYAVYETDRYIEQLEREKETLKYIIHQCRRAVPHHDIDGVHNNQVCLRCKLNRLIDSAWQDHKEKI